MKSSPECYALAQRHATAQADDDQVGVQLFGSLADLGTW
jgi:hypothetical protein